MDNSKRTGWWTLAGVAFAVTSVWMFAFPWLGTQPAVRARIEHLDRQGIDPAAMYYTDIEAMGRIESNVADAVAANPDAFWGSGN